MTYTHYVLNDRFRFRTKKDYRTHTCQQRESDNEKKTKDLQFRGTTLECLESSTKYLEPATSPIRTNKTRETLGDLVRRRYHEPVTT